MSKGILLVNLMVAMDHNGVIGKGDELPWPKLPKDMKRFKDETMGFPVIMGRKTYESIPEKFRPLPGRENIVLSRDSNLVLEGAAVSNDYEQVLMDLRGREDVEKVYVIGGSEIYRLFLFNHLIDMITLTRVCGSFEGNVLFPKNYVHSNFTRVIDFTEVIPQDDENPCSMIFETWVK